MQIVIVTNNNGQNTCYTEATEQVNCILLGSRRAICLSKEVNDESNRVDSHDGKYLNSCQLYTILKHTLQSQFPNGLLDSDPILFHSDTPLLVEVVSLLFFGD